MDDKTRWVVFDIEGDGLEATKVYCLSFHDFEGKKGTLLDYPEIETFFQGYEVYVGHNIRRWDLPTLQRLVGIRSPTDNYRVVDTLGVAWYLEPKRENHKLEGYGEDFGIPKPQVDDWHSLDLSVYVNRCETDVEINTRLWRKQADYLISLYQSWGDVWRLLGYLDFKLYSAALAEQSRWKLDTDVCKKAIRELSEERDRKFEILRSSMPRVDVTRVYEPPKRFYNADGQPGVLGLRWEERAVAAGFSPDYRGPIEVVVDSVDGNPSSHPQVKDWLFSLGWKPQTFKYKKNKETGELREIPQINKEAQHGGGLCDSVKELYEKEPNLEVLDNYYVLNHRISILNGFLRDVSPDGYLTARVAGLTNTLRFKHAELVNMPKPEKAYAEAVRASLVAPDEDHELCGSDMSSLEDRIKQHFLYKHDPDYVNELNREDYDPHIDIAILAGGLSQDDGDRYKRGEDTKRIKPIRSVFKNGNYACQYGAGPPRIALTCGISVEEAKKLHKAYWDKNWAIKAVAHEQEVVEFRDFWGKETQLWLYNPISGFYYSLRFMKDVFSTLVQGSAAYCFDLWLQKVLKARPELTGQFHDEFILTVKKGYRDEVKEFLLEAIRETNEALQLDRELGIDIQFGDRYSDIH